MRMTANIRLVMVLVAVLGLTLGVGCKESCDDGSCTDTCGSEADTLGEVSGEVGGEVADEVAPEETSEPEWVSGVTLVKITVDGDGETHFSEEEVGFAEVDYAPPAPPVMVSATAAAAGYLFLEGDATYDSGMHPAPAVQLVIVLRGTVEVEVSDGEVRSFGPGSIVMVEDTSGKGHITRTAEGSGGAVLMAVPLP